MRNVIKSFFISVIFALANATYLYSTISFSGKIVDTNNNGVAGVSINISQWIGYYLPIGSPSTDSNGNYTFSYNGGAGTYQIVPSKTNCSFNPTFITTSTASSTASFNLNFTASCNLPSLSVSASPSNPTINSGGQVNITITVTSGGSNISGASVNISASLGTLSPTSGSTNSNGQFSFTYTAPTVSSQQTATLTVSVSKSGYNSATTYAYVTINPLLPDLIISNFSSPSSAIKGNTINVNCYVKNQGQADAGSFYVYYYLGSDKVGQTNVSGLLKDNIASLISVPLNISTSISDGRYDLKAKADATGVISESNETNNEFANKINICSKSNYIISGYIKDANNNPVSGVSVTLSGVTQVTDSNGYFETYSSCVDANYSYTLTPSKTGYTFNPDSYSYSNIFSDKTNQNFTATFTGSYSEISGYVKDYLNNPMSGITVRKAIFSGSNHNSSTI